ncbi:hypothetical protein K491DRAFT_82697 [Lophiostoma macrostomum CBS 122681]|uniref:SET domain-containing protein n=1 Tax=Lophiostoma macrostomum CBS 122681 TaxID=1314788 RepID=A0A6A6SW09_9PLEO|nr:hypothetical protein K491DRAFT_82697 [Lophiostoma macrostomum CBS 122681]
MEGSVGRILQERLAQLRELQQGLTSRPYSAILRLQLAKAYRELGYPDLAAGDAYKALLLLDELTEGAEYHDEALSAAQSDIDSGQSTHLLEKINHHLSRSTSTEQANHRISSGRENIAREGNDAIGQARIAWSKTAHALLIACLIDCGCLRSALDYNNRALKSFPAAAIFASYHSTLNKRLRLHFDSEGDSFDFVHIDEYPDKGLVRRELYPWNDHEPDRFSSEIIEGINDDMAVVASKLEVKVVELPVLSAFTRENPSSAEHIQYVKQLGVFAKEDVAPGEIILQEKSLLTAVSRLHESYCDACSTTLPSSRNLQPGSQQHTDTLACEDCEEVYYCSEECLDLAQTHYHSVLCGISLGQSSTPKESSDILYRLLLIRALALAEVQGMHPLDLKELRYIWGDYHGLDLKEAFKVDSQGLLQDPFGSVAQTLPFSFQHNILMPLNILEKMDVNIFENSLHYDTWVFNTLYSKFRGTASGRHGPDGRPELGAVHPLWSIANHSCDPNVTWEWEGNMEFRTREHLVDWAGRNPDRRPGLRKGDEVLSHYCDVRLPVKERREWAIGALGGECMCSRCLWEDAQEHNQ